MLRKLETIHHFASFAFPRYIARLPKGKPASRLPIKPRVCGPYYVDPGTNPADTFFFYLESDFQPFTRWTWCDEVEGTRIRHDGWFCDEYQDQTIRGLVVRLSHGRGFLAGWSMGEGMASSLDRSTVYDGETEAARAADRLAEDAAEAEHEYQEKARAEFEAEMAEEDAKAEAETLAGVLVNGDGI